MSSKCEATQEATPTPELKDVRSALDAASYCRGLSVDFSTRSCADSGTVKDRGFVGDLRLRQATVGSARVRQKGSFNLAVRKSSVSVESLSSGK